MRYNETLMLIIIIGDILFGIMLLTWDFFESKIKK